MTYIRRLTKKRCPDYIGVGGLGVSPSFKKSPKIGGSSGLIKYISAVSLSMGSQYGMPIFDQDSAKNIIKRHSIFIVSVL